MNLKRPLICILLGALVAAEVFAAERTVLVAEIRGTINPATANYLESSITQAELSGAQALVVQLDTPGGLLTSVRSMAQAIDRSEIPVVIYVYPAGAAATSAGALLTIMGHVAAMAPGTNIGAAHPVGSQGEDIKGAMAEKVVNDTAAFARGMAELRGRPPLLAEEIVSKSKSFSAGEALDRKLIDIIAASPDELMKKLDGRLVQVAKNRSVVIHSKGAEIRHSEMTWGQHLLTFLANPNIATLLMTVGMLLIYVEISTPGAVLPGLLGGIMLLVAFTAFQMMPIRVGGLIFLILGVVLILAEPFVISHGAIAAAGILSFILGILWVFDPSQTSMHINPAVWVPAVAGLAAGVAMIAFAASRTALLARKTLAVMGGGGISGLAGYHGHVVSLGGDDLHGKAEFRGETWDFECQQPVKVGDSVEALRTEGMRVIVKRASKPS